MDIIMWGTHVASYPLHLQRKTKSMVCSLYELSSPWKEETTTKGCNFHLVSHFEECCVIETVSPFFLRNFMEQISYSNCCCASHLVSQIEECSVGGCCEESVISFSWNSREVHSLFSLLLGLMAKVITPLNLGGWGFMSDCWALQSQ
jgi:hypothetical protein